MNDERKDGGPAFPRQGRSPLDDVHAGMSLRDYMAAKAMQAMFNGFKPADNTVPVVYQICAIEAYRVADAMLAARNS